jgi:cyclase
VNGPLLHLRLLEPAPGILAWYDGRVEGHRFAPGPNWVDDGALSLGIASYAVVDGDHALVYDTHVSVAHAERIRADLTAHGVRHVTVVLSHWHLDHVAGTEAFADCRVIANVRTADHLTRRKDAMETATYKGAPAINPLILPTETFDGAMTLRIGAREARLLTFDIHSDDATVLWLPDTGTLLAGDTLEDPVTYVADPGGLDAHLADLDRLAALNPKRILPNHGSPDIIATGGYGPALIAATIRYTGWLTRLRDSPALADRPLRVIIADDLADGSVIWFDSYEDVHRENIAVVLEDFAKTDD